MQNPNPHVNFGLQRLQRCLVEVRQRNSEKEGTLESAQSKETELTDGEKGPQPSCSFPTLEKEKRKKANENHLRSLLGRFVVVSMLTRKT